jgi:hypothetical protein
VRVFDVVVQVAVTNALLEEIILPFVPAVVGSADIPYVPIPPPPVYDVETTLFTLLVVNEADNWYVPAPPVPVPLLKIVEPSIEDSIRVWPTSIVPEKTEITVNVVPDQRAVKFAAVKPFIPVIFVPAGMPDPVIVCPMLSSPSRGCASSLLAIFCITIKYRVSALHFYKKII